MWVQIAFYWPMFPGTVRSALQGRLPYDAFSEGNMSPHRCNCSKSAKVSLQLPMIHLCGENTSTWYWNSRLYNTCWFGLRAVGKTHRLKNQVFANNWHNKHFPLIEWSSWGQGSKVCSFFLNGQCLLIPLHATMFSQLLSWYCSYNKPKTMDVQVWGLYYRPGLQAMQWNISAAKTLLFCSFPKFVSFTANPSKHLPCL